MKEKIAVALWLAVTVAAMACPAKGAAAAQTAAADTLEMAEIPAEGVLRTASGQQYVPLPGDRKPQFRGGDLSSFGVWVTERIEYPHDAFRDHITGRVVVSFIIEKSGKLTHIKVEKTAHRLLSDEVVRVVKHSPRWRPATQYGQNVRVRVYMPVDFKFPAEKEPAPED